MKVTMKIKLGDKEIELSQTEMKDLYEILEPMMGKDKAELIPCYPITCPVCPPCTTYVPWTYTYDWGTVYTDYGDCNA